MNQRKKDRQLCTVPEISLFLRAENWSRIDFGYQDVTKVKMIIPTETWIASCFVMTQSDN